MGTNTIFLVFLQERLGHTERTLDVYAQRRDPVRGWQVGSHLQAKERVLTRDQPCQHLDPELPASRTMGQYISAA